MIECLIGVIIVAIIALIIVVVIEAIIGHFIPQIREVAWLIRLLVGLIVLLYALCCLALVPMHWPP